MLIDFVSRLPLQRLMRAILMKGIIRTIGIKTNEEYSRENRVLRRDIKQLDSENSRMEKEIAKLQKQLEEAESAIRNLKAELLKAQTELTLSRMGRSDISVS